MMVFILVSFIECTIPVDRRETRNLMIDRTANNDESRVRTGNKDLQQAVSTPNRVTTI